MNDSDFFYTPYMLPCMMMQKQKAVPAPVPGMVTPGQVITPETTPVVIEEQPVTPIEVPQMVQQAPQCPYMAPSMTPGMIQSPCMVPGITQSQYTYPQNLPAALQLIREAVAAETEDRMFYGYLINAAPSEEEKDIIRGIQENEINHFGLFRQIYCELTGQMLPPPGNVTIETPASYCEGIKKAILGEQNAVRRYRKILFALQNRVQINMLTEIITDELRHGSLYNYLYTRNGCRV